MTEPKHTPGPWELDVGESSWAIHWRGHTIAHDGHDNRPLTPGEVADARLMRAAPELAHAARWALSQLEAIPEHLTIDTPVSFMAQRENLRAALRRAGVLP